MAPIAADGGGEVDCAGRFLNPKSARMIVDAEKKFSLIASIVTQAAHMRAEMKLDPKKKIPAEFSNRDAQAIEVALRIWTRLRDGIFRA